MDLPRYNLSSLGPVQEVDSQGCPIIYIPPKEPPFLGIPSLDAVALVFGVFVLGYVCRGWFKKQLENGCG